jgi:hypothetical protein
MRKRSVFPTLLAAAVGASAMAAAMAAIGRTVYYHGQTLTQDARQVDGRTYVPLADVARALGGRVASRGGGLEIVTGGGGATGEGQTAPGGTNQVRGATGSVGDWFFNGYWRFRVNSVDRPDTYAWQFYDGSGTDRPSGPNDELVVFHCTIKNGRPASEEPILTVHGLGNTALTDDQGQSYVPTDIDVRSGSLLPGAAKDFAVVFSVPKGTKLKDLVFTLRGYAESNKASDVRVHLGDQ